MCVFAVLTLIQTLHFEKMVITSKYMKNILFSKNFYRSAKQMSPPFKKDFREVTFPHFGPFIWRSQLMNLQSFGYFTLRP